METELILMFAERSSIINHPTQPLLCIFHLGQVRISVLPDVEEFLVMPVSFVNKNRIMISV